MKKKRPCVRGCGRMVGHMSASGLCRPCQIELQREAAATRDASYLTAADYRAMLERVAPPTTEDWGRTELVRGDCIVTSDIHVPHHDPAYLATLIEAARRDGIRQLVIGGDFIDFTEISRFQRDARANDVRAAVVTAVRVLGELAKSFAGGIWVIKGNHELRLEGLLDAATQGRGWQANVLADLEHGDTEVLPYRQRYVAILEQWTQRNAPEASKVVHWLPQAEIEIEGPPAERPWRVVHQRNGSRNPTMEGMHHWQRWQQPIICTHTHLSGQRIAPDGVTPIVQLGMGTVEAWHSYAWREPGGYPRWVQSYGIIRGGRLRLLVNSPYMDGWAGGGAPTA